VSIYTTITFLLVNVMNY